MAANRRDGEAWAPGSMKGSRAGSCFALALEGEGVIGRRCFPLSRRQAFESFRNRCNVLGGIAAAAAGNINEPCPCKIAEITGHVVRPQIESGFGKRIWQTGIR